eukprot:Selendium_serpulae@DN4132_c0_g1_i2.p2
MQIFVRGLDEKTVLLNVEACEDIETTRLRLEEKEGIPADSFRLVYGAKQLQDGLTYGDYDIHENSTLFMASSLLGGVIEPTMADLARKFNCEKMVCRKCYARLPKRAKNCRKKKCGHTNQIRPKKQGKK